MYIWVILATFIVAIYSFNLSHRPDMKELYIMPQAEAIIGKMVSQHKAARKFLQDHTPPDNGQSVVSYFPGELTVEDDLEVYLPYGFKNNRGAGDFRTLIYCLDKTNPNLSSEVPSCSSGGAVSCCADPDAIGFLVTFGCVPRKWRNARTNSPKPEFYKALRGIATSSTGAGYVEHMTSEEKSSAANVYNSDMALRARSNSLIPIPQFIVNGTIAGADVSFSEMCGNRKVDSEGEVHDYACDKCITYITPIYTN